MSEEIRSVTADSPEARLVLDALAGEYDARYGDVAGRKSAVSEINRYPAAAFRPPLGDFLILQRGAQVIAGGALMPHDAETAEVKRVWTHPGLRRQGLSRRVMSALEASAAALGYSRLYLTTGHRQPEAVGLYLSLGYRPLFDTAAPPELYRSLPFEKHIGKRAGQPGTAPLREISATPEAATAEAARHKARHEAWLQERLAGVAG